MRGRDSFNFAQNKRKLPLHEGPGQRKSTSSSPFSALATALFKHVSFAIATPTFSTHPQARSRGDIMASTPQILWGLFLKILGLAAAIGVLILVVCPEPSFENNQCFPELTMAILGHPSLTGDISKCHASQSPSKGHTRPRPCRARQWWSHCRNVRHSRESI